MSRRDYLFVSSDLRSDLENHERELMQRIHSMDPDELLSSPLDDLVEHFLEDYRVAVPVLQYDHISVTQGEARVDVSQDRGRYIRDPNRPFYLTGTEVTFFVPFEGDANLFSCAASSRTTNPPKAEVSGSELVVRYTRTDHNAEAVKLEFDAALRNIQQHLGWIANDVRPFNDELPNKIRSALDRRREKLLADRGLVASLGYELRQRPDAPRTYTLPTERRKPPIRRATAASVKPFEPEPELAMKEYEHILDILSSMVSVIERSPAAFKRMKEEELRQHFLVQLNGQYEGQATGETFNFEGKTDILIRAEDRNVFIGECKFWRGAKALTETVDQLLGYATWRDTKTAILLFNRTKNLSAVLAKIPEVMESHPSFKRVMPIEGETRFRYVFAHRDDPEREIIVTILVFDVPA
jgi:hypothetical protein